MDRQKLEAMDLGDIGVAIGQMHAMMAAAHATLLELVAVFDRREGWQADGATAMTGWLEATLGITYRTACEWLRMADALEHLPALAASYFEGRLSAEQIAAATLVATPETDQALAQEAPRRPASWLMAAAQRERITRQADRLAEHKRSLTWWWDQEWLRLSGKLPAADGAVVAKVLERIAEQYGPDPESGLYDAGHVRLADALVELAATRLGADDDAERSTVVLHVDAAALAGGAGVADLEDGPALPIQVARRLACYAWLEVVAEGGEGALGIGRARRQVPAWLARHLRQRDQGCRFPGCGSRRHLQAHHIQHWAEGGPTDAANLVMVCRRHHRLVHERGWSISLTQGSDLAFVRPDGRPYLPGPPPMGSEVKAWLESWGLVPANTS
ncbi:MAG: HNH endonuclease signature motif containing protein [Actinomycetota bacterium]